MVAGVTEEEVVMGVTVEEEDTGVEVVAVDIGVEAEEVDGVEVADGGVEVVEWGGVTPDCGTSEIMGTFMMRTRVTASRNILSCSQLVSTKESLTKNSQSVPRLLSRVERVPCKKKKFV